MRGWEGAERGAGEGAQARVVGALQALQRSRSEADDQGALIHVLQGLLQDSLAAQASHQQGGGGGGAPLTQEQLATLAALSGGPAPPHPSRPAPHHHQVPPAPRPSHHLLTHSPATRAWIYTFPHTPSLCRGRPAPPTAAATMCHANPRHPPIPLTWKGGVARASARGFARAQQLYGAMGGEAPPGASWQGGGEPPGQQAGGGGWRLGSGGALPQLAEHPDSLAPPRSGSASFLQVCPSGSTASLHCLLECAASTLATAGTV